MSGFRINIGFVILVLIKMLLIQAKAAKTEFTTSPTPTTTLQRTIVAEGANSDTAKEGLSKRDTKSADLKTSNSVSAKSYEPPPEFYRGPGSTGPLHSVTTPYYSTNSNTNNNNKHSSGFISKPVAFPDTGSSSNKNNHNYSPPDNGVHLANSYNSWQHLRNKTALFGALLNKTGLQDRISVGHYGNPLHDSRPYGGAQHHSGVEYIPSGGAHHYASPSSHTGGGSAGGYAYEGRPYAVTHPHIDYGHHGTTGTYYAGGSSAVGEGIPFDVYGGAAGGGKGHYAGSGGEYSYTYSDMNDSAAHKTFPDFSHKALLAKSFLIPLASAAVLGIAAALVSNPLLLQLGTVSGVAAPGSLLGKRKRRATSSTPTVEDKEENNASVAKPSKDTLTHPYRGHHRRFGVRT